MATAVGYAGGHTENPSYEDVCYDNTGHAETVNIEFDPARIRYEDLLERFWGMHDPTTPNRQGPNFGSQYRSVIFYHSQEQEAAAETSRDLINSTGKYRRPIVTEIVPAGTFWNAEDYHQQYGEKRGAGGCRIP